MTRSPTHLFPSTIRRSSTTAGLAVLLGACSPTHQTPRTAASTREAPAPHLRAPVNDQLGDPSPARGQVIADASLGEAVSLGRLLDYADQRSPILLVARSTRSRAEAERIGASILLTQNPTLSAAAGPRFGRSGTGVDVDVSLMQQIQIAGERGARLDAADRLRDLTNADIEQLRWTVHCDVHAAFHRTLVESERAELAERVVNFQKDVLRVVEQQISAGEAAALTLRLAQAEVAQAEQILVAAKQTFFASRIRLAQLAGWPVIIPPLPTGVVDEPREPPTLNQLTLVAREHLPSLRAKAARVSEAEARSALAAREGWSRPSVGVQYRREGNPTSEGHYDIFMGALSLPIPSFQRNQGAKARTQSDVTVSEAELSAAQQLLQGQILEARSEVVAAAQRTRAYGTEILPRFEENLTLLRRSFELGEIDILALSTGRERFLRIQSDALLAQQDYFVALASLERVVGVDLFRDDHHEKNDGNTEISP